MEESSDNSRLDQKPNGKKYITYDKDQNSYNSKNNTVDEGEENPTDENSDKHKVKGLRSSPVNRRITQGYTVSFPVLITAIREYKCRSSPCIIK